MTIFGIICSIITGIISGLLSTYIFYRFDKNQKEKEYIYHLNIFITQLYSSMPDFGDDEIIVESRLSEMRRIIKYKEPYKDSRLKLKKYSEFFLQYLKMKESLKDKLNQTFWYDKALLATGRDEEYVFKSSRMKTAIKKEKNDWFMVKDEIEKYCQEQGKPVIKRIFEGFLSA